MTASEGALGATWSVREKWLLAVFATAVFTSLAFFVHPWFAPVRDGTIYIGTARSILAGEGFRYLGIPYIAHRPGFSLLIAPILSAFGTNFYALNLFVSLFGATGVVLLATFLRNSLGLPLAIVTALAVWLNPRYQELCNQVMADVPGTTLVLACLLLDRRLSRAPSLQGEIALGIAIGASVFVRSICLVVVPAIVVARVWRELGDGVDVQGWARFAIRRVALVSVVVIAVLTPWSLRNQAMAPPAPVDQFKVYDYSTGMWHQDSGDPASPEVSAYEVLERVPLRIRQVTKVLGMRLQATVRGTKELAEPLGMPEVAFTLLFAVACIYIAFKRREAAELFVIGASLLTLIFFGFLDRLIVPIYVVGLGTVVELIRDMAARWGGPRVGFAAAMAALLIVIVVDFEPRKNWHEIASLHRDRTHLASQLNQGLSPSARIATRLGFTYGVYLDRPVYSLHIAVARAGDAAAAEEIIDRYNLDTVVLTTKSRGSINAALLSYFGQRYGPGKAIGSTLVWHVRPKPDAND